MTRPLLKASDWDSGGVHPGPSVAANLSCDSWQIAHWWLSALGTKQRWWQFPSPTLGQSCWFWSRVCGKRVEDLAWGDGKIRSASLTVCWGKKWSDCKASVMLGPLPADRTLEPQIPKYHVPPP